MAVPRPCLGDAPSRAEAGDAAPLGGSALRRGSPAERLPGQSSGPPTGPADLDRWTEDFRRKEISSLSARVEDLERRLRRRTIVLVGALAFGALGAAAAAGVALVRPPAAPHEGPGRMTAFPDPPPPPWPGSVPPERVAAVPEGWPVDVAAPGPPQVRSARTESPPPPAELPAVAAGPGQPGDLAPAPAGPGDAGSATGDPEAAVGGDPVPSAAAAGSSAGGGGESSAPDTRVPAADAGQAGTPPVVTVATPSVGRFAVYFFSVRPSAVVPDAWRRLAERHPEELAGLEPRPTRPVDVPGKGTFYAVEAGAFATPADAQAVCDRVRWRGQSCRVLGP